MLTIIKYLFMPRLFPFGIFSSINNAHCLKLALTTCVATLIPT